MRRRSASRKLAVYVAVGTTALLLCLAEAGLRLFYPIADPFRNQRQIEVGAYVPNRHEPNFSLRIVPEPGLPGVASERRFRTNRDGYVGPALSDTSTSAARIFLVGGSTMEAVVLGEQGNPATLIAQKLETSIFDAAIVNTGHSGDASFDHLALLGHRIAHESPTVVVFLVGINDLIAIGRGEAYDHRSPDQKIELDLSAILRLGLSRLQVGRLLLAALGQARLRQWDETSPIIETHYRQAAKRCAGQPASPTPPKTDPRGFERNLRQLVAMTRAVGATPVLVTQPHSWRTTASKDWWWMRCFAGRSHSPEQMRAALEQLNDVTRAVANDTGTPLVDLATKLEARHMYDDVHFNDAGAEALSEHFAQTLSKLLEPKPDHP